jgi:hypothetical protein
MIHNSEVEAMTINMNRDAQRRADRMAKFGYIVSKSGVTVSKPSGRLAVHWQQGGRTDMKVASPTAAGHVASMRRTMSASGDLLRTADEGAAGVEGPSAAAAIAAALGPAAARRPASRNEAILLCAWLQEKLATIDPRDDEATLEPWDSSMVEVTRQVGVHCAERGRLMELVRLQYLSRIAKLEAQLAAAKAASSRRASPITVTPHSMSPLRASPVPMGGAPLDVGLAAAPTVANLTHTPEEESPSRARPKSSNRVIPGIAPLGGSPKRRVAREMLPPPAPGPAMMSAVAARLHRKLEELARRELTTLVPPAAPSPLAERRAVDPPHILAHIPAHPSGVNLPTDGIGDEAATDRGKVTPSVGPPSKLSASSPQARGPSSTATRVAPHPGRRGSAVPAASAPGGDACGASEGVGASAATTHMGGSGPEPNDADRRAEEAVGGAMGVPSAAGRGDATKAAKKMVEKAATLSQGERDYLLAELLELASPIERVESLSAAVERLRTGEKASLYEGAYPFVLRHSRSHAVRDAITTGFADLAMEDQEHALAALMRAIPKHRRSDALLALLDGTSAEDELGAALAAGLSYVSADARSRCFTRLAQELLLHERNRLAGVLSE